MAIEKTKKYQIRQKFDIKIAAGRRRIQTTLHREKYEKFKRLSRMVK